MRTTTRQLRMIWALSHQRGLDEAALRTWVEAVSGQSSLRRMTVGEAARLIGALQDPSMTLDRFRLLIAQRSDRLSNGQEWMLNQLAAELGWSQRQVVGLAQRMYGRVRHESLTRRQAAGLIEALKAVRARHAA